jgi:DNA-binding MarR family transcriptional regulator
MVDDANLLGALVTALADRSRAAISEQSGLNAEDPAALVTLYWQPSLSIQQLSSVVGRSHAATVRIIDRLEMASLVDRTSGDDQRKCHLVLTAAGRHHAQGVMRQRHRVFADALAPLDSRERATFAALLAKVTAAVTDNADEAAVICRLCDERRCSPTQCPITLAVQ